MNIIGKMVKRNTFLVITALVLGIIGGHLAYADNCQPITNQINSLKKEITDIEDFLSRPFPKPTPKQRKEADARLAKDQARLKNLEGQLSKCQQGQSPLNPQLSSQFLKNDPCSQQILAGTPYNMDDPNWLVNNSNQNRDVCAYKFFAAFHMLGYNTDSYVDPVRPQLQVLKRFQLQYGLPATNLMTADAVTKLDSLLTQRENQIGPIAKTFPLYSHMQPLDSHDISQDALAMIYALPMNVLSPALQMSMYEALQCIAGQCLGFIQDVNGNPWPSSPIGLNDNYRFAGAYFDPKVLNGRLPSAAVFVGTVMHEFAHYLDGLNLSYSAGNPSLPLGQLIDTRGFYDINYDMSQSNGSCAPRRSDDPKDWITKYGFDGSEVCPQGMSHFSEEWAEAVSTYLGAGKYFRAAAAQNTATQRKYNWLKVHVFRGIEYDTDLIREVESGCNDVPGYQQQAPGYMYCNETYIWDGQLRVK